MSQPRELRAVVGERVRAVREAAGLRQQDLADAAKTLGLNTWSRTRIAALERGEKAISAEDLIRLVTVLSFAAGHPVDVAELLDSPERVALSGIASIRARSLAEVLCGADPGERVQLRQNIDLEPRDHVRRAREMKRAHAIAKASGRDFYKLTVGDVRAVQHGLGEADERAARELGEADYPFETLCAVLWGRSLSTERDARLAAGGRDQGSAASVAARRGRVTRELLSEARALLARADEMER